LKGKGITRLKSLWDQKDKEWGETLCKRETRRFSINSPDAGKKVVSAKGDILGVKGENEKRKRGRIPAMRKKGTR